MLEQVTRTRFSTDDQWDAIGRVQATNDADAWHDLLSQFAPLLSKFARRGIRNVDDIEARESVLLERFVRVIRKLDRTITCSPSTYLFRSLSRPINHTEHRGPIRVPARGWSTSPEAYRLATATNADGIDEPFGDCSYLAASDDPVQDTIRRDMIQRVRWAVDRLPPLERDIIRRRMDGMQINEIAVAVGLETRRRCDLIMRQAFATLRAEIDNG